MLCAAAPSLALFLAGRALQGLGAAMLMPNSLATLSASFTGEKRGRAVGTWAAAGAISGALAPMLGGWLVDGLGWPFIFLLNLPIAAGRDRARLALRARKRQRGAAAARLGSARCWRRSGSAR